MRRIVPVSEIKEIGLGQNEEGLFQLLFEWGDGDGKVYFVETQEILDHLFNECVLPFLGRPDVYAWDFDERNHLPAVILVG